MVVIEEDDHDSDLQTYTLVDGQQRLLSISIIFCALANQIKDPDLRATINSYLVNKRSRPEAYQTKIRPTTHNDDLEAWRSLVNHPDKPPNQSRSKIYDAYQFFVAQLRGMNEDEINRLFILIRRNFLIVFINLKHEIVRIKFSRVNNTGLRLTQADLIRNFVAMRLPETETDVAYTQYWEPIEKLLNEDVKVVKAGRIDLICATLPGL